MRLFASADARPARTVFALAALALVARAAVLAPPLHAATDAGDAPRGASIAAHLASASQTALEPYARIDQWPLRQAGAQGIFQNAVSLDVAQDGRVYIADAGAGGIHTMLPGGAFLPPFGATGDGAARLGGVGRIAIDQAAGRLYVVDTGIRRVVVFDLDGGYVAEWKGIDGAAIAVGPDGRVYVADREKNAIAVFDAGGQRLFDFGQLGTADGQFSLMSDVSVSPDGKTIAVGDLNLLRVQLFDLAADGAVLRKVYMLNAPKFSPPAAGPPFNQCRAGIVYALGGDTVWVGDGTGACVLRADGFDYAIATSAAGSTICKQTVRLPRIRFDTGQYYAIAAYDPNVGPCYSARRGKDTRVPTTPAVIQYRDIDLSAPLSINLTNRDARDDGGLVAPWFVSAPAPGQVFVLDNTRYSRLFAPDGAGHGTVALTTRQTGGVTFRYTVERADGTGTEGEIFGYYRKERRGKQGGTENDRPTPTPEGASATPTPEAGSVWIEEEHGVGRFKSETVREYGQDVQVVDPIWTQRFTTPSLERSRDLGSANKTFLQVIDVAYHDPSDAVYALAYERQPTRKLDDAKIVLTHADGTPRQPEWDLPDDTVTSFAVNPYIDLSVGPDGRVYALDDYRDVAVAFDPDGTRRPDIPVAPDVKAIAGGADGVLFGLRESGYVERYAPDGAVTARFDGRPFATADPETLSAIAADETGRVYVADALSSVVSVFFPAPPGSPDLPVPADATCTVVGDKTAGPARVNLGDATDLTMSLDGVCGIGEEPTDVMLVVVQYPDLLTPDPAERTIKELRRLVSRLDLRQHRLGIVSYFRDAELELPLTQDKAKALAAIQKVSRKWPPTCYIYGDYAGCRNTFPVLREGLKLGQASFDAASQRRRVLLVYHPDYCSRDFEYRDGDCRGYAPAEDAAKQIRDAGTQIVVYDGNRTFWRRNRLNGTRYQNDAQPLASSDADIVLDYAAAQHRMVRYHVPAELATGVHILDTLPANMRLVAGSPSTGAVVAGADVSWDVGSLAYSRATFTLSVVPQALGRWPTNVEAHADYVDGWGHPGRVVFPIPFVDVVAPPTATATATTAPEPTATTRPPTPTAVPRPIYLPLSLRERCDLEAKPLDVALAIDASASMAGAKIAAAKAAAHTFASVVTMPTDHVAVIAFNETATVHIGLSGDRAAVDGAIDAIALSPGTRIDAGLAAARAELNGAAARPTATHVIALLTDGRQEAGPEQAEAEAAAARADGARIFTIGLGDDVDVDVAFLTRLAGATGRFYAAPTPAELEGIYTALAAEARTCGKEAFWGGR
ncbi:MAG: VWA domain-containing protein, partial [Ardenticatenales bacterium]